MIEIEKIIPYLVPFMNEPNLNDLSMVNLNNEVNDLINGFQVKFPKDTLDKLSIDDYVLGNNKDSYSYWLEFKTKVVGSIQGGSALKHGIWRSKKDGSIHTVAKFAGSTEEKSMDLLRSELVSLVKFGYQQDFETIEANKLSNTVKYKTLYMYYPDYYFPVFSNLHYDHFIKSFGLKTSDFKTLGEKQHLLLEIKKSNDTLNLLPMYEYARFLYYLFGTPRRSEDNSSEFWIDGGILNKTSFENTELTSKYEIKNYKLEKIIDKASIDKSNGQYKIDYVAEEIRNSVKGLTGEQIAMDYEKNRLKNYPELINKIKHVSNVDDSLGFDIQSSDTNGDRRYIEVKTTSMNLGKSLKFNLTKNELDTAKRLDNYWVYIISDVDKSPKISVFKNLLDESLSDKVDIIPKDYIVSLNLK